MAKASDVISNLLARLIGDGSGVLATEEVDLVPKVDGQAFAKWRAECRNLIRMLGEQAKPWQDVFDNEHTYSSVVKDMIGTLEGIKATVDRGLLVTVRDLIVADTFEDLLEQAEYLLAEGYFLAAGVLGRAVVEEHF